MSIRANSQWYGRCLMTAAFVVGVLGVTVYGQVYQGNQYGFNPVPSYSLYTECIPCPVCYQHCVCPPGITTPAYPTPYWGRGEVPAPSYPGSFQGTVPGRRTMDSPMGDIPYPVSGRQLPPPRPTQTYDARPSDGEKSSEEDSGGPAPIEIASSQRDLSSIPGFGDASQVGATGVTGSAVPNMIGDSTSIPTRSLMYHYRTWQSSLTHSQPLEHWVDIAGYYDRTLTDYWFKRTTGYTRDEFLKANNYGSFESLYTQIENSPTFPITSIYSLLDDLHQSQPPGFFLSVPETYLTNWVLTNAPFAKSVDEFVNFLIDQKILSEDNYSVLNVDSLSSLEKLRYVLANRGYDPQTQWRDANYFDADQVTPSNYPWEEASYDDFVPISSTPSMYLTMLNMAENFNAQVQDRIYFDLRFFGGAQGYGSRKINGDGVPTANLARATLGFEKPFFQKFSLELRVPVVMTLNSPPSDERIIGSTQGNQIGNVSLIFKHAFRQGRNLTLSRGIGINLPTAPGIHMSFLSEIGRPVEGFIDNAKMSLVPYIGGNWQSNDQRSFAHGTVQLDIAVGQNRLRFYDTTWSGERDEYRTGLHESSLARLNFGGGRWFINREEANSRFKLGVMAECHYTANFDKLGAKNILGRIPDNKNSFSVSETKGHWQMINLVFGLPIQTQRASLMPFVTTPITGTRYFDIEGGLSFDVRF